MTARPAGGPARLPQLVVAPDDVTPAPDQPRRAWVEQVMGMPVSIHVRGPLARLGPDRPDPDRYDPDGFDPDGYDPDGYDPDGTDPAGVVVREAFADLRRTDRIFSPYRAGSQVSRIRAGLLDLAAADPWVQEVAGRCDEAAVRTGGWFDAHLPDGDGVRGFDPTGLVKGWAVERVTRRLAAALPAHDVLVNAGGDIAVRCGRTDTPDWVLAVEDPADRGRTLARVPLRTGGTATSGTAARGAHILDPRTGLPVARGGSVTVIGPDLMWADVHATAAFAMGASADGRLAEEYLAGLADHLSFVVRPDGTTATLTGRP